MPSVFVFSAASKAAQKHFEDTIKKGLPVAQVLPHLSETEVADLLSRAYPDGVAYLWAGRPGAHDELYWNKMELGDLVLCYQHHTIVAAAYLVGKVRSVSLAEWAWPDAQEKPYSLVYFLSKPEYLSEILSIVVYGRFSRRRLGGMQIPSMKIVPRRTSTSTCVPLSSLHFLDADCISL